MSASQKSRRELKIGTIFFHCEFECKDGIPKDRYFIVVHSDATNFYCFTTSTREYLRRNPRFLTETSCLIEGGATALPKDCVVDCRFLYEFDDIIMSNRLNTGRAFIVGELPRHYLESVRQSVKSSKVLERHKKAAILKALSDYLDS